MSDETNKGFNIQPVSQQVAHDLMPRVSEHLLRATQNPMNQAVQEIAAGADEMAAVARENWASAFHERLSEWIGNFDKSLDNKHEVGVRLVSFGQTVIFHLRAIGYYNPSLIAFSGETDDGQPVELIQHVSQISILLMKMKRKNPETPKKPIGFQTEGESDAPPAGI